MPRIGLGVGLNLPRPIWFGGSGTPPFPSANNVGYYSAEDVSKLGFSSANNVNFIDDISSAGNDLSQVTASANMTFIEHDTATQFTLVNQPTLIDIGGGELVASFDGLKNLKGLDISNNVSFEFTLNRLNTLVYLGTNEANTNRGCLFLNGTSFRIYDDSDGLVFFDGISNDFNEHTYTVTIDQNNLFSVYEDSVFITSSTVANGFSMSRLGRTSGSGNSWNMYNFKIWNKVVSDPTNITETPDFELIPSEANCNTTIGQPISRWNSTTHKPWLNYIESDGTGQFYTGLPDVATDEATLVFYNWHINPKSALQYLIKSTTTNATIRINTNNKFVLDDEAGTSVAFEYTILDEKATYVIDLNDVTKVANLYVNGCLEDTLDITGLSFDGLYTLSHSSSAIEANWTDLYVYDKVLSDDERNYFFYLRSEDTNEILLPPILPNCPI